MFFDRGADAGPALIVGDVRQSFNPSDLVRKVGILDRLAEPTGVVSTAEMIAPGAVIDTLSQLQKQHEVLCSEIERSLRPTEIEALIRAQLALGILALVTATFGLGQLNLNAHRLGPSLPEPDQRFIGFQGYRLTRSRLVAQGLVEPADRLIRALADTDERVDHR